MGDCVSREGPVNYKKGVLEDPVNWMKARYNERILLSSVKQDGRYLAFASEDMENYETIVYNAIDRDGGWMALEYASENMKNNETIVLLAVRRDGMALDFASENMKNNETVVLAAVQKYGGVLKFASEDMKNTEGIVLAAVQNYGFALQDASEDMKNKESVVLAAVQNRGYALRFAPKDMQNNESVVLAAVTKDGRALRWASEDMKKKESIVLAAVQHDDGSGPSDGRALYWASEDMKNKECVVLAAVAQCDKALECAPEVWKEDLMRGAGEWGIDVKSYARAKLNPMIVQLDVPTQISDGVLSVSCLSLSGQQLATVVLQQEEEGKLLQQKIAEAVQPPEGSAGLHVILPGGQCLREVMHTSLREFLQPHTLG